MRSCRALVAAMIACVVTSSPAMAEQWIEHRSPTSHFRAEFPGPPEIETIDIPTPRGNAVYRAATTLTDNHIYKVVHMTPPPGAPSEPPESLLRTHRDAAASMFNGKVLFEHDVRAEPGTLRKILAVTAPPSKVAIFWVTIRDQDAYFTIYLCPPDEMGAPEGRRFMASFRLLPR